jgi:bifunctional non-homologous end joining protein LigD
MKINKHEIDIINRDKVFFPQSQITKGQLIDYYEQIADTMLMHVENRLLTLHRFPDGIQEEGFYQKDRPEHFPEWINSKSVRKEDGTVDHVICNDKATLVYLANQGTLTFHTWLSKINKVHKPDKIVFDLDPPSKGDFKLVKEGARAIRKYLKDQFSMHSFLMTTGSKGIHVVLSIKIEYDFDTVRQFARAVAENVAQKNPDNFTTQVRKAKRKGRLFIDYLRNAYAQTSIVPYSLRAIEGAPVATPLEWEELGNSNINAQTYHMGNIFRRLGQTEDPWKSFNKQKYSIQKALKRLDVE